MAELVDAVDSKSTSSNRVPVRLRIGAPYKNKRTNSSFFIIKKLFFRRVIIIWCRRDGLTPLTIHKQSDCSRIELLRHFLCIYNTKKQRSCKVIYSLSTYFEVYKSLFSSTSSVFCSTNFETSGNSSIEDNPK